MSVNHIVAGGTKESRNDYWRTPSDLKEFLEEFYEFDLDAAASHDNHLYPLYLTEEDDSLTVDWSQLKKADGSPVSTVFLNPPFSKMKEFLAKAYEQSRKGLVVVVVAPANTDSGWFHDYARLALTWLLRGRVQFLDPETGKKKSNTKGTAIFHFVPVLDYEIEEVYLVDWK